MDSNPVRNSGLCTSIVGQIYSLGYFHVRMFRLGRGYHCGEYSGPVSGHNEEPWGEETMTRPGAENKVTLMRYNSKHWIFEILAFTFHDFYQVS